MTLPAFTAYRRSVVLTSYIRFRTLSFAYQTAFRQPFEFLQAKPPRVAFLRALPDWLGGNQKPHTVSHFDFFGLLLFGRSQGLPCRSFTAQPTGFFCKGAGHDYLNLYYVVLRKRFDVINVGIIFKACANIKRLI